MRFSENWLREWVSIDSDRDGLLAQLAMLGLEVDSADPVANDFQGVIVGEVTECEQHPNADRLSLCQVSTGNAQVQVVCGAPNVRTGLKVALATVGADLGGGFKIKKTKLRGSVSEGMICSESELGLAEKSEGILELPEDAPLGGDFRNYLQLNDVSIDCDITPNRGDCLSVTGIARDVAAVNGVQMVEAAVEAVPAISSETRPVHLAAAKACAQYVGRVIKGVNVAAKSPMWLQERLRRSGLRSIDPIVDVTNFVMLELGQPMHAFDLAQIQGGITVRYAHDREKLTLLDGSEIALCNDCLVIADDAKPLALAGVMGGEHSGIATSTQDVFLESAFFAPTAIAGRARRFGLHTDSSHRFERGVDPNLQQIAIERATQLLVDIVGGQPGPVIVENALEDLPAVREISLPKEKIKRVLGLNLSEDTIQDLLQRLEFTVKDSGDHWQVRVPPRRFDVSIPEDLIEEIARLYGYNNIDATYTRAPLFMRDPHAQQMPLDELLDHLVASGYSEAISYSFTDPKIQKDLFPDEAPLELSNPISPELSVMRVSIWPGLLKAYQYNTHRQQAGVRLVESGLTYRQSAEGIIQQHKIAGLAAGTRCLEQWGVKNTPLDFFDVKNDIVQLLDQVDPQAFHWQACTIAALHPGQTAALYRGDVCLGHLGALHPKIAHRLKISEPLFLFEFDVVQLQHKPAATYHTVSKFPSIRRDIAIVVNQNVTVAEICATINGVGIPWLQNIHVFDIYQGSGVPEDQRSIALALIMQHPEKTLVDADVQDAERKIIAALANSYQATLRT